jgi:hypothetical protein
VPSLFMIQMCVPLASSRMNATRRPSGDHCGCTPAPRRRTPDPSARAAGFVLGLVLAATALLVIHLRRGGRLGQFGKRLQATCG